MSSLGTAWQCNASLTQTEVARCVSSELGSKLLPKSPLYHPSPHLRQNRILREGGTCVEIN